MKHCKEILANGFWSIQHSCNGKRVQRCFSGALASVSPSENISSALKLVLAGAGKTVLASLVFEHFRNQTNSNIGVACAYLNYKESTVQSLRNILGALWRQLCSEHELQSARVLYQKHSKQGTKLNVAEVESLVKAACHQLSRVYIILDALDEYLGNKDELVSSILEISQNVRLLVTCRSHVVLPEDIETIKLEIKPPAEDIQSFILGQINKSRRLKRFVHDGSLRKHLLESITSRAEGMFLFAKLQMELLDSILTKSGLLEALQSLPSDLDELYARTLDHIKLEKPVIQKLGMSAISWVAFTKRPLTVLELQVALAIPESKPYMPNESSIVHIEDILEACHGLIIVNSIQEGATVRLVHYSAQEFMNRIQAQEFPKAHITISRTLLTSLHWAAASGHFSKATYQRHENDINTKAHPLLLYSQYFLAHVRGNLEHMLKDELIEVIPTLKKYPNWHIDPWSSQYLPDLLSPFLVVVAGDLRVLMTALQYDTASMQDHKQEVSCSLQARPSQKEVDVALSLAAASGYLEMVQHLILIGANVNALLETGTALYAAANRGHHKAVQLLLQANADSNLIMKNSETALYTATERGFEEIVQLLLKANADPNVVEGYTGSALRKAIMNGYEKIVQLLLEANADPNIVEEFYGTPLQISVIEGNQRIIRLLLDANADPNIIRGNLEPALYTAAKKGNQEIVQILLEANADPNIVEEDCDTVLYIAAKRGYLQIIKLLLEANADPNIVKGDCDTVLYIAAKRGYLQIVKLLLEANADPNIVGYHGSALQIAAERGNQKIVHLLLQANADPNLIIGDYETPLHAAAEEGHQEIVQLLLLANADPNLIGGYNGTALQIAVEEENEKVVQLLLEANADPDIVGGYDSTALQIAAQRGHQKIVQLLLEANADPNIIEGDCTAALCAAAQIGDRKIVQLLLQAGADPNIVDENYGTALYAAASAGYQEIVQLLLQANTVSDPLEQQYWLTFCAVANNSPLD